MTMQTCRTCLKSRTKTFPLTKPVTESISEKTYAQILKKYAQFEFVAHYERHLPQYLCLLCCNQLKNTYFFIEQAQQCNAKLINDLSKQFSLQEQVIDLPQQQEEVCVYIKKENPDDLGVIERHSSQEDSLVTNKSFIAEPIFTRDEKVEYEIEDDWATNKSFIGEPILTTEQIIEYDSEDSVKMDNINLNTEMQEDSVLNREKDSSFSKETETLETEDSLLEAASFKTLSKENPSEKQEFPCENHNNHQAKNIDNNLDKQDAINKSFQCKRCKYIAKSASGLKYHNRAKHPTEHKTHKCNFCSYTTTISKHKVMNHIKAVHIEQIKILKANANSSMDGSITFNINNILSDNCPKNDLKTVVIEEENISDNDNNHDKEELSDEDFIRNMLNIKRNSTTSSLVRRCEECGKIYSNYYKLIAHQQEVHKSEDKFWLCPYCDKKCKRKDGLKYHIRNSHGPLENKPQPKPRSKEKRFMCAECSYTCRTSSVLNIHIRVHHTGEKPYKCDICSKSFVVPYDLKLHSYLHTGERPFKCSVCLKSFRDPSNMRRHMRLHSNENPFTCDECGKSFTQSYNLSLHKRTHLKGNKLSCSVCCKFFKNNSMLNIHQISENHYDEVV